jgi:hypothetical protein
MQVRVNISASLAYLYKVFCKRCQELQEIYAKLLDMWESSVLVLGIKNTVACDETLKREVKHDK